MDCRVNLIGKNKSVRLVLVGMCGAAGFVGYSEHGLKSGLSGVRSNDVADEAETGHPLEGFWKKTWIRK